MFKIRLTNSAFIAISLLGLSACGGSDSGPVFVAPVILDGVFKDSNVSGLSFVSGREKGISDKDGKFTYEKGEPIVFSLGGINFGSTVGKPIITPLDLSENGSLDTAEVINKARFLMMLDKDNNPSNGIDISAKVQLKAKDWSDVAFKAKDFPSEALHTIRADASVADSITHEFPSVEATKKHLRSTLLCANAGAFSGEYSTGIERGNIALILDPTTGEVSGSSYNSDNQVSVDIKSTTALDYDNKLEFVSTEDSGKKFTGRFKSENNLDGNWVDTNDAFKKGTFIAERIGNKSAAVYRYSVAFTGDDKGVYTFDVDVKNNITGTAYSVSTQKESKLTGKVTNDKLVVSSVGGDIITGFIDSNTLEITTGVWINGSKKTGGSFVGGGCKLN